MLSEHLKRDARFHKGYDRTEDCSEILLALQIGLRTPKPLLLAIAVTSVSITALLAYRPDLMRLREHCSRYLSSYLMGLSGLGVRNLLHPRLDHTYWVPTSLAKSAPVRVCPVPDDASLAFLWGRLPSQGFPSLKSAMKHASRLERPARITQWLALLEEFADRKEIPDQYLFMFIDNAIALSLDQRCVSEIEYSETSSIMTEADKVEPNPASAIDESVKGMHAQMEHDIWGLAQDERLFQIAAQRIRSSPSPAHADYGTFFIPEELAEHVKEHNEVSANRVDYDIAGAAQINYSMPRESYREKPFDSFLYRRFGTGSDDDPTAHPWRVPMLDLVKPTPPGSVTHSRRGTPSPESNDKNEWALMSA